MSAAVYQHGRPVAVLVAPQTALGQMVMDMERPENEKMMFDTLCRNTIKRQIYSNSYFQQPSPLLFWWWEDAFECIFFRFDHFQFWYSTIRQQFWGHKEWSAKTQGCQCSGLTGVELTGDIRMHEAVVAMAISGRLKWGLGNDKVSDCVDACSKHWKCQWIVYKMFLLSVLYMYIWYINLTSS